MVGYSAGDLDGWEFKIVRSHFGRFSNQEVVRRVVAEEAQNGWELLEKFDNHRIRFKRRVDKRALHSGGNLDPYRTNYGVNPVIMPIVAASAAAVLGLIVLVADRAGVSDQGRIPIIAVGMIVILAIAMVAIRLRSRN